MTPNKKGRTIKIEIIMVLNILKKWKQRSLSKSDFNPEKELVGKSNETNGSCAITPGNAYDEKLIAFHEPHSAESEQFKMIRTSILFPKSGKPPHSIMITSSIPGEGKSFVSSNLAVSIAQYVDRNVLLLDCDIRIPSIHKIFGFDNPPGISEYLTGKAELSSLFLKPGIERMRIISGGTPPFNPSELLSSNKMTELLMEIKSQFEDRLILIDSPPYKLTSDTAVIARQVDGVILVVRCGSTPKQIIMEIAEKIGKEKILGVVVNRSETFSVMDYKYKKKGYYDKYCSKP